MAVPIVGEKIMGALMARRSFQAPIQALGILEHLSVGRAPACGFLFRSVAALILQLAVVEAHKPIVARRRANSQAGSRSRSYRSS